MNVNENNTITQLLVVVGPSGSGKGTLISRLMNEFQEDFCFSVSHTTRKPRIGEVDGVNYHFIDKEEFERMLNNEDFIEFNLYSNNYYGTSKQQLESLQIKKKIVILEIDIIGAKKIIQSGLKANYIGILPPTLDDLKKRLIGRNKDKIEDINQRMEISAHEIVDIQNSNFFYSKIINDDIEISFSQFKRGILEMYPNLK